MIPESEKRSHQDIALRTVKFHAATIINNLSVLVWRAARGLLSHIAEPRYTSHCASKLTQP